MKQILLVCNAGMSTSMLVKKMQQSATERGIEISIQAKSMTEAKKNIHEADVILIGPQIRYELLAVKEIAGNIPVDTIDMRDYGIKLDKMIERIGSCITQDPILFFYSSFYNMLNLE